jgi:hypothetical protein
MCRLLQQSSGIFFTTQSAAAHGPVQQRQKINFISNKIRRSSRAARWFVFQPKIPIWVNFGGPLIGKCLYILWPFGIF